MNTSQVNQLWSVTSENLVCPAIYGFFRGSCFLKICGVVVLFDGFDREYYSGELVFMLELESNKY
jgi:hypothetical protein